MKRAVVMCIPIDIVGKLTADEEYMKKLNDCKTMSEVREVVREFCRKRSLLI